MKTLCVMLTIAVLGWGGALCADSLDGQGLASGNVVLRFSGTKATATFNGAFSLTGHLVLEGSVSPFSASGWASGTGKGDTATMTMEAWATFVALGSTLEGEAIAVQGGLTLSGASADTGGSTGSGIGAFFATVFIGERRYHAQGSADGTASGAFVVPADPLTMELAGDGFFSLSGKMALVPNATDNCPASETTRDEPTSDPSLVELLPWDPQAWPEDLLAKLLSILTKIAEPSEAPDSAADSP
jgi:hypothetical protein